MNILNELTESTEELNKDCVYICMYICEYFYAPKNVLDNELFEFLTTNEKLKHSNIKISKKISEIDIDGEIFAVGNIHYNN